MISFESSAVSPPFSTNRYLVPALVALVMVLALVLRLISIDSRGLWTDEAFRVLAARQATVFDTLRAAWAQPPSAPLYWLGLHWWIVSFGHGDVIVRLFSVFPSVAAIPAIYALGSLLGGKGTPSKVVGLLSALLLALSPFAVEVGQEATMYAWTLLFATLAAWAGLKFLRDGTGRWSYVVFAVLLLYTHYMGSLLLAELFLAGLVLHARRNAIDQPAVSTRSWVLVHLLVALAWTPWLVAMGVRLLQRWDELSHLQHRAGLADLHLLASYLSVSASAAATWPWPVTLTAILAGVTLAILALLPYPFGSPFARLVGATVAAFITLLVGLSAITGAWIVQPRYLALVLPLALAVIASGVVLAWFRVGSARVPLRVLALLLLGTWLITQVGGVRAFYTSPVHGRDGVREIGALLSADVQSEDIVLSNHQLLPWSISQYYSGPIQALPDSRDVRDGYLLWPTPDVLDFAPSQLAALQPLFDAVQPKRVWLLYLPVMDPHKMLLTKLGEQFGKSTLQHFAYCDVYLFESTAK